MTKFATKVYPEALQRYELHYCNDEKRILHACGMTNAYALSRELWPELEIMHIHQLDDSWKK